IEQAIENKDPLIEVEDEYGVIHRMWVLDEPGTIEELKRQMQEKKLYIADGHHRYETALNYWREQQAKGVPIKGEEAIDRAMMSFVSIQDEGLAVLPTHRVIFGVPDFKAADLFAELQDTFEIRNLGPLSDKNLIKSLEENTGREKSFLFAVKGHDLLHLLQLKSNADPACLIKGEASPVWKALEVNILHKLILEKHLGINERDLERQDKVLYLRDPQEALRLVLDENSKYQAVFFLNPPKVEEVVAVADNGECMPPKSTDFYPKMLTGLVINKLNL
ncbi:MAG: DUF1015 domain-containing protein, partial [Deltaproteobacteria bacterium]